MVSSQDLFFFERFGGIARLHHLVPLVLHILRSVAAIVAYCLWAGYAHDSGLSHGMIRAFFFTIVVSSACHILCGSVFYVWAWRFPEPEGVAEFRCTIGTAVDLFVGDVPLFIVETGIVYRRGFASPLFGSAYVLLCVCFAYTLLRVWLAFVQMAARIHHLRVSHAAPAPYRPEALRESAALSFAYRLYGQREQSDNDVSSASYTSDSDHTQLSTSVSGPHRRRAIGEECEALGAALTPLSPQVVASYQKGGEVQMMEMPSKPVEDKFLSALEKWSEEPHHRGSFDSIDERRFQDVFR